MVVISTRFFPLWIFPHSRALPSVPCARLAICLFSPKRHPLSTLAVQSTPVTSASQSQLKLNFPTLLGEKAGLIVSLGACTLSDGLDKRVTRRHGTYSISSPIMLTS